MTPDGKRHHHSTGSGLGSPPVEPPTLERPYTRFRQADPDSDGEQDYVFRTSGGDLRRGHHVVTDSDGWGFPVNRDGYETKLGSGWNRTACAASGDATGDGRADFFVRDSAGDPWLHRGTGNPAAPLQNRVKVGSGWNAYSLIG